MKNRILLLIVLGLIVYLVVLNIGMAGNGHVEVVNENVTLEEKNTTLTNTIGKPWSKACDAGSKNLATLLY
jgi:hypothetical protein